MSTTSTSAGSAPPSKKKATTTATTTKESGRSKKPKAAAVQAPRSRRRRQAALCATAALHRISSTSEEDQKTDGGCSGEAPKAPSSSSSSTTTSHARAAKKALTMKPLAGPERAEEIQRKRKASVQPFQHALSKHLERLRQARFLRAMVGAAPNVEAKFACPICQSVRTAYRDCDRCHAFVCSGCARRTSGTNCCICRSSRGMSGPDKAVPLTLKGLAEATTVGCAYCEEPVHVSDWKEHLAHCRQAHCEGCGAVASDASALRAHTSRCAKAMAFVSRSILQHANEVQEENQRLKKRLEESEGMLEMAARVPDP